MIKNLYEETMETLKNWGKTPEDILFIATATQMCNFETFAAAAKAYDYDAGFGLPEVNMDLVIVGEDWWLGREEYDGSEWWHFYKKPSLTNQKFTTSLDLSWE